MPLIFLDLLTTLPNIVVGLLDILKTIQKGNIVLVASYADPSIQWVLN